MFLKGVELFEFFMRVGRGYLFEKMIFRRLVRGGLGVRGYFGEFDCGFLGKI